MTGRRPWRELLAALVAVVVLRSAVFAAPLGLEVNGRDYYGTVFTDNGEIYAALDVVGPLLLGAQFHLEAFDVTLRRCTFTFVPAGGAAPQKMEIFGCTKRGAAVYAPLKPLLKQVGGSFEAGSEVVRVAYPPAAAVARATPTPQPTPRVVVRPTPVAQASPTPAATPTPTPLATPAPQVTPTPASSPTVPSDTPPLTPELAMAEVATANGAAFAGAALIQKIEVYHPVSPDPSDVIPRTDLAGLKVYMKTLAPTDQVSVRMWNGRAVDGEPAFKRMLSRFHGQEMAERFVFVRLPLAVEPGWHTVRVDVNQKETVDYRFITY